jgi:TonB family protein
MLSSCAQRRPAAERTGAARTDTLPVDVYADTGRGERLHIAMPAEAPGPATVRIARVTPVLPEPTAPQPSLPDSAGVSPLPPVAVDPNLKPPLLRTRAPLAVPPGVRGRVELDVRVNESGVVTDARWAGGSADSALVRSATACALAMRFYPAMRAGNAVAVWCREHFDFGEVPEDGEP